MTPSERALIISLHSGVVRQSGCIERVLPRGVPHE